MNYLLVTVILGLLILAHESGHFFMARLAGVPVARFSVGFGPALWSRRRNGVEYRFSWVPLGGYVLLDLENENDYLGLPLWKKTLFTLGGPAANIALAMGLYAVLAVMIQGWGLDALFLRPLARTYSGLAAILTGLLNLFDRPGELAGVVGLVVEGGRFMGLSLEKALALAAFFSLNLAVFNLLPLPPLDGGKLVLDILHGFSRRLAKAYLPAMAAGWLLIVSLMVYATVMDVHRYLT